MVGLLFFVALSMYWAQGRYLLAHNLSSSLTGDIFLIDLHYDPASLALGDLVAFRLEKSRKKIPLDATWAKRIAGLPSETIEIRADSVFVGGRLTGKLQPDAMAQADLSPTSARTVPSSHFFVIGDHSRSFDSRYDEFGFVASGQILGKATLLW